MAEGVLALADDAFSELLLRLSCRPLVDVFLLDVHRLLVQLELLLVGTHSVEELCVA